MQVKVLIPRLFNHETQRDYKMGQQVADSALELLANEKRTDGDGNLMVSVCGEVVTGSSREMPGQLSPDDTVHAKAHKLFSEKEFSFASLTRATGGDSDLQKDIDVTKEEFGQIFELLKKDDIIMPVGRKWGYAGIT